MAGMLDDKKGPEQQNDIYTIVWAQVKKIFHSFFMLTKINILL